MRDYWNDPIGWDDLVRFADTPPAPARCKCSHPARSHGTDRKGRYGCFNAVCGCIQLRLEENQ